jgi:hypothetical protein
MLSKPFAFVFFQTGTDSVFVEQFTALGGEVAFVDLGTVFREPLLMFVEQLRDWLSPKICDMSAVKWRDCGIVLRLFSRTSFRGLAAVNPDESRLRGARCEGARSGGEMHQVLSFRGAERRGICFFRSEREDLSQVAWEAIRSNENVLRLHYGEQVPHALYRGNPRFDAARFGA